jgi:hypothetical protein
VQEKDFDFMRYFNSFANNKETKQYVTNLYIQGRINKDEFMRRMKNAN